MSDEPLFVLVCQHTSCRDRASAEVLMAFQSSDLPEGTTAIAAECQGQCSIGPTVRIVPADIWYCQIAPDDVPQIVRQHLREGQPLARKLHPRFHPPV